MNMNKSKLSIIAATLLAISSSAYASESEGVGENAFTKSNFMENIKLEKQTTLPLFEGDSNSVNQTESGDTKTPANNTSKKDDKSDLQGETPKTEDQSHLIDSQTQKLDKLTTQTNLGILELTLLNQEIEKKELLKKLRSDDIEKLINMAKSEAASEFRDLEDSYLNEINSLRNEISKLKSDLTLNLEKNIKEDKSKSTNLNIYVTEISGIGRNLEAKMFYSGGNTATVYEGSYFGDNIEVVRIDKTGVLLNINNKNTFITVADEDYAFSKMFASDTK